MNDNSDGKVTLEELLRLKRAERPNPEFWEGFDRELRARQLSALVRRRPRWQSFLTALARHQLGLGAAAALLVALVGMHGVNRSESVAYARPPSPNRIQAPSAVPARLSAATPEFSSRAAPSAAHAPVFAAAGPGNPSAGAPAPGVALRSPDAEVSLASGGFSGPVESDSSLDTDLRDNANGAAPVADAARDFPLSTSEHLVAVSLGAGGPAAGEFDHSDGLTAPTPASLASEPLSRVDPASEERRSRLLASSLPPSAWAAQAQAVSAVRSRHQIDDDRLYTAVSRYESGGDDGSIRF